MPEISRFVRSVGLPPRGITDAGRYSVRWFSAPLDQKSQQTGDFWALALLGDQSLVVLVGDAQGHGERAAALASGVPDLFAAIIEKQPQLDLAGLRDTLDRELAKDAPGYTFEGTLAWFRPQQDRESNLQITPGSAVVTEFLAGGIDRVLTRTAHLFGFNYLASGIPSSTLGLLNRSFADHAEIVIGTDGLFDQPAQVNGTVGKLLIFGLPILGGGLTLFDQVLKIWREAVAPPGPPSKQTDDMLIVSVRRTTEPESEVFAVLRGDQDASRAFLDRFRRLVWKLVRRLVLAGPGQSDSGPATSTRSIDGSDAEDMFQEAIWHVFRSLPKWHGGLLQAWVRRVAANYLISFVRKRGKFDKEQQLGDLPLAGSPEDDPQWQARLRELRAVLLGLSPKMLRLIELCQDPTKSEQAICEELGIARRTYFNWKRAIERLVRGDDSS